MSIPEIIYICIYCKELTTDMQDRFRALLISNDLNLRDCTDTENFEFEIEGESWFSSIRFSSNYDTIIIDGSVKSKGSKLSNVVSQRQSFATLSNDVRMYLKSGGVVIFLNSGKTEQKTREESASNYDWIQQLNLPEPRRGSRPYSVNIHSQSPNVSQYLHFTDETRFYFPIESINLSHETLAVSRSDEGPVAISFSEYQDRAGHNRTMDGKVLFLPRPNSFGVNPREILKTLVNIGVEYSPRGFDSAQKRLPEFRTASNTSGEAEEYIIDEQLAERCLGQYEKGNYTDAVSTAGRILEDRVKQLCPPELKDETGRKLMTDAFNKAGGALRLAERDDEQEGIMFMFSGAIGGIRNVAVHRPNGGEDIIHNFDRQTTRAVLFYFDYLLNLLKKHEQADNSAD